jgi:hypothetical protein
MVGATRWICQTIHNEQMHTHTHTHTIHTQIYTGPVLGGMYKMV